MMAQRSKGFIRLEWTCPNCNTRNPGPEKTCTSCGAAQPENVQFERGAGGEFVKDENEIKQAAAGADIHCGYCGARNPATSKTCGQCGADLVEGKRRESGREMGAAPTAPTAITCPNCGQSNPGTNTQCANCGASLPKAASAPAPQPVSFSAPVMGTPAPAKNVKTGKPISRKFWIIGAIISVLLLCCCGVIFTLSNITRDTVSATVQTVYWQTSVTVEEEREVHYSNESGRPPSSAYNVDCRTESRDVCTEKTVDQGNGYAEVIEECHTETDEYCSYDVVEWKKARDETQEGYDLFPSYARPSLSSGQREGDTSITMTVYFSGSNGDHEYHPSDITEFQQYEIGSEWNLNISWLGNIVDLEPAR